MAKKTTKQASYKELAQELAAIIDWFESDDVDLDQALIKYADATKLLAQMEDYLKSARNTISKITATSKA